MALVIPRKMRSAQRFSYLALSNQKKPERSTPPTTSEQSNLIHLDQQMRKFPGPSSLQGGEFPSFKRVCQLLVGHQGVGRCQPFFMKVALTGKRRQLKSVYRETAF
jgi:hypothetical protein